MGDQRADAGMLGLSAFSTRPTQEAKFIPTTGSVTVAVFGVGLEAISVLPFTWTFVASFIGEFC